MKNKSNKINFNRRFSVFVPLLFFLILILILVLGVLSTDKEFSESENRKLSSFPTISVASLLDGRFMSEFEDYMSDQFVFRNKIVSVKTSLSRILGKTEINGVYIGKNGRLYEVQSDFNVDKTEKTIDAINNFSSVCDIENQYLMLIPNATQIIKDELPNFLKPDDQSVYIENIYDDITKNLTCIDAVTPLMNYDNKEELYFRTDHHWTSQAAFCVFKDFARAAEISYTKYKYETNTVSTVFRGTLSSSSGIYESTDKLSVIFPSNFLGKFYINNFETQEKSTSCFEIEKLNTSNQYEVFFGGNFSRIHIITDNLNGKNLLIFKDSYANCFVPLLIPYFESIVMIDPRYFGDNIENVLEMTEFTHLLYLYNVNTFLEDTVLNEVLD